MKLAAVDIGTNSIHMIVVRVHMSGAYEVLDREKDMVRLGESLESTGQLAEAAMQRALDSLSRMKKLVSAHDCSYVVAAATSAVREAENSAQFRSRVQDEIGWKIRVLSGEEEAACIFRAIQDSMDLSEKKALVVDLGGGSTEIIVGNSWGTHLAESLPVGIVRMTDAFAENPERTPEKNYKALAKKVRHLAKDTLANARAIGFDLVIGTSGTMKCLGELLAPSSPLPDSFDPVPRFRIRDLEGLTQALQAADEAERAAMRRMNPKRASTIAVGATIVLELFRLAEVERVQISSQALREGLILETIRALPDLDRPERRGRDLRRRSVQALARAHPKVADHGKHVARLALQLFDQTGGLHGLGPKDRELLEFAAQLHDIGASVGFGKHHKHTYYLLSHAELPGFDPEEIHEMAVLARYHRKSLPDEDHPETVGLAPKRLEALTSMASLLRIADGLDRSHRGRVRNLRVRHDGKETMIQLEADEDVELEIHAATRKHDLFAKTWGREPCYQVLEGPVDRDGLLDFQDLQEGDAQS